MPRFIRALLLSVAILGLITSCNSMPKPTDVYQTAQPEGQLEDVVIDENKVLIDSRSFMDHSLTKLSGSVHLNWTEFAQMGASRDTRVNVNYRGLTRRLATYGVNPKSKVVIVGNIKQDRGESGRLAWTLLFLGVKNVEILEISALSDVHFDSRNQDKKRPSVNTWQRAPEQGLEVYRKELLNAAMLTENKNRPIIVDVRSEREYLRPEKGVPQIGAINIDWRQFFSDSGRPNKSIMNKLSPLGLTRDRRIIVVSNNGVRSGAVAYALYRMGYERVGNFSSGLSNLASE